MESWDLAAITVVDAMSADSNNPILNHKLTWTQWANECTGSSSVLLMGGIPPSPASEGQPAFLMYKNIRVSHPWVLGEGSDSCGGNDEWRQQVADAQRAYIEVGAVQTVEGFIEGGFDYTSGQRLHYYLLESPPLLDTFSCPSDAITHAWYAHRGRPMLLARNNVIYKSYQRLKLDNEDPRTPREQRWLARIGWEDYPALMVPPLDGNFAIGRNQQSTPTLQFYTAIAVRTYFFPFSYVPVVQAGGWRINFNGSAIYDPVSRQMQYMSAQGPEGLRYTPTLTQPETGCGPYNSKIQGEFRSGR